MKQNLKFEKKVPVRAVGYLRVSIEPESNSVSLDMQREKIEAYAKAMGWELIRVYEDRDSGLDANRKMLKEMLSQEGIRKILIYRLDRFSRCLRDTLNLIHDVLRPKGIELTSIEPNFDSATPEGMFFMSIHGSVAEYEARLLGKRLTDCRLKAAKSRYAGGGIPYGFKVKDKALVESREEVEVLRKMRKLRQNSHLSYPQIARVLNDEGIPTRQGKKWNAGTVFVILKRSTYRTGRYRYGSSACQVSRIA